ncbi:hypothetical protein C8Q76DRAFT_737486 [Earliella scabrosa]|nr:hypothetical protein C8Q76DRAFT_737486 [Earliella scabrosa]
MSPHSLMPPPSSSPPKCVKLKGVKKTQKKSTTRKSDPSPLPHRAAMSSTTTLSIHAASKEEISDYTMLASIDGVAFEDVKFWTFSRRAHSGTVDTPRGLFGNSALVRKASSYFDMVLATDGFSEGSVTNMDAPFPADRDAFTEAYDYTSDSDLDDDPADSMIHPRGSLVPAKAVGVISVLTPPPLSPPVPPPSNSPVPDPLSPFVWGNPSSTITPIPEVDETVKRCSPSSSEPEEVVVPDETEAPPNIVSGNEMPATVLDDEEPTYGRQGRVVFIEDIASRTWKAFIFYAYSGKLSFAPLTSTKNKSRRRGLQSLNGTPTCSPKSMYRFAEKYDIGDLKKAAFDNLRGQLSPKNIFVELFSSFTALYPEIHTMQFEYLKTHISEPLILDSLPAWFQALEDGRLRIGAASIFASLIVTKMRCPRNCNSTTRTRCDDCGCNF